MTVGYVLKRIGMFFLVVWAAATINFFIPRMAPGQDPVYQALAVMAEQGGVSGAAMLEAAEELRARFGLDQPLWRQYVRYLADLSRFDLGVSIAYFPAAVMDTVLARAPWTLGLLVTATLMTFVIGSTVGALIGWPYSPRRLQVLLPPLFVFSAVPYYLLGLLLVYLLAITFSLLPYGGGFQPGRLPGFDVGFVLDILKHALLPAMAIVISDLGTRALIMRGTILSLFGEDYITHAENRGLRPWRIFTMYGMRNALLPQLTWLALALGHVASGAVVVEVVFNYPGLGRGLFSAIKASDFPVIYGIVFFLVVSIALMTLLLDLTYPLVDPRIRYQKS